MANSIETSLKAGARPEITVAVTHGLMLKGSREKLSHESVREVLVTDTVDVPNGNWQRLQVISVAPLIAGAIRRFMADGSLGNLAETVSHA